MDERYAVFRKDREMTAIASTASKGGGVLIAVRSDIKCDAYTNNIMDDLEAVCVRIPLKSGSLYIYCLYIQPSASIDIYRSHIDAIELLNNSLNTHDSIKILGDFNLGDTTKWFENDSGLDFLPIIGESQSVKSVIAREVTSKLLDLGLFQMTNLENAFHNTLDLIYTNSPEIMLTQMAQIRMLPSFKSDESHVPIVCSIECSPSIITTENTDSIYCFKRANYDEIRDHLEKIDFSSLLENIIDINDMSANLYDTLRSTVA